MLQNLKLSLSLSLSLDLLLQHLQHPSRPRHHLMSNTLFLEKLRFQQLPLPHKIPRHRRLSKYHLLSRKPISLKSRLLRRKKKRKRKSLQLSPKSLLRHLRPWLALSISWLLSSHHLISLLSFRLPIPLGAPILLHSCSTVSTHLTTLRQTPSFNFCSRQTP